MNTIKVMVISAIEDKCLQMIKAVNQRLNVIDASGLWDAPDMVLEESHSDTVNKEFDALIADTEVLYGYRPPSNLAIRAPKLKWFQTMLAGVDHFLDENLVNSSIKITNMSGLHAASVAEFAFSFILNFAKQVPQFLKNQWGRKWVRFEPMLLEGSTVGIVGLGNIGRNMARLCKSFRMNVIATHKSAKQGDHVRYVDEIIPMTNLKDLLRASDFVVMFLPFTSETRNLIGEEELRTMKSSSYLINMGRGQTIVEEALLKALKNHWVAGAGLDAYEEEPLPVTSSLWDIPNLILSPHVSGRLNDYNVRSTELFCDNLKRYCEGKRLKHIVNKELGY